MFIETLKANITSARKTKDTKSVLIISTFLGELQRAGLTTHEEAVALAAKLLKAYKKAGEKGFKADPDEVAYLEAWLPVQLTDDQLIAELEAFMPGSLQEVMKHFNSEYKGMFDNSKLKELYTLVSMEASNIMPCFSSRG